MNTGSSFTSASDQNSPAFTAGGKRDTDINTPTIASELSPNRAKATPAPEGTATRAPTTRDLSCPLPIISSVGNLATL